jgi:NADH-quinone oxidoreductase subunit L
MVAAGVYLTARIYGILTPGAHLFVAVIGLVTLVIAACMALVMTDIKRVLAYSTISQLGYMVLALGVGAWGFALFHLVTHAFFKCCLFQCSGSVIQAAHHQQDMRSYGGLWRKMPITSACYFVCMLAIAGASIPFTEVGMSGFYSKDGIIAGALNYGHALGGAGYPAAILFGLGPLLVAYLTVFYMARSFALTFLGRPRQPELFEHAHEGHWTMWVPQLVLAALAVLAAVLPFKELIAQAQPPRLLQTITDIEAGSFGMEGTHRYLAFGLGWLAALGLGLALYLPGLTVAGRLAGLPVVRVFHTWFQEKFYFDALYDIFAVQAAKLLAVIAGMIDTYLVDGLVNAAGLATKAVALLVGLFDNRVVDGIVNGAARFAQNAGDMLRATQVGRVRAYVLLVFASIALGAAAVLALVIVR